MKTEDNVREKFLLKYSLPDLFDNHDLINIIILGQHYLKY